MIHIIDILSVENFPAVTKMAILAIFDRAEGDPERPSTKLSVTMGDDVLVEGDISLNFAGDVRRHQQVIEIDAVIVTQPGELKISVVVEGNTINWWTIHVRQIGKAQLRLPLDGAEEAVQEQPAVTNEQPPGNG